MSQRHYGPGMSGAEPRMTRLEAIGLELARQLRWVTENMDILNVPTLWEGGNTEQVNAYYHGFRAALEQLDREKGSIDVETQERTRQGKIGAYLEEIEYFVKLQNSDLVGDHILEMCEYIRQEVTR